MTRVRLIVTVDVDDDLDVQEVIDVILNNGDLNVHEVIDLFWNNAVDIVDITIMDQAER